VRAQIFRNGAPTADQLHKQGGTTGTSRAGHGAFLLEGPSPQGALAASLASTRPAANPGLGYSAPFCGVYRKPRGCQNHRPRECRALRQGQPALAQTPQSRQPKPSGDRSAGAPPPSGANPTAPEIATPAGAPAGAPRPGCTGHAAQRPLKKNASAKRLGEPAREPPSRYRRLPGRKRARIPLTHAA
jgi:hypothetical protein